MTECIDTAEVVIFRVCCDIKYRDGEHFLTLYSLLFHPSLGTFHYQLTQNRSVKAEIVVLPED